MIRKKNLMEEPLKMQNLFRGLSRIILAIARIPQPKIGSFRFNDNGTITLDNRPLTSSMTILEAEGAPRTIASDKTYTSVDAFVSDLTTFHDERFLAAPNAVTDQSDSELQMAYKAFHRAVTHHFIDRTLRNGPFALYLSDDNSANFMIDDNWNVTGMFDLEWIISGPPDLPHAPFWLTWDSIDWIAGKNYGQYEKVLEAFMAVFKEEESHADMQPFEAAFSRSLSSIMEESWKSKRYWFHESLLSVNAMVHILEDQIVPLFSTDELAVSALYKLWNPSAAEITARKLHDHKAYLARLSKLFGRDPPGYLDP